MRTLHLLRHAKSSWDDPALRDAERPLADRGRQAVQLLHAHLEETGARIDLVLVSPARRARQTWEGVASAVDAHDVRTEPAIYEATATGLLELVHGLDDAHRSVMLVGHDPGFHDLAVVLAGGGDPKSLRALQEKYPTGALASLAFDCSWHEVDAGRGRLVAFVRPRDLR